MEKGHPVRIVLSSVNLVTYAQGKLFDSRNSGEKRDARRMT